MGLLDHTSPTKEAVDMPKLAAAIRAKRGRLFVEAHPKDADRTLRASILEEIDGSLATHRYMVSNEPDTSHPANQLGILEINLQANHSVCNTNFG